MTSMTLDITEQERRLLLELLEAKNTAMFHELHHTDSRDYRDYVRQSIELLEGLKSKVERASPSPAAGV
jgi:ADP-dependent phosphofructokinase/glucokinase